MAAQKFCEDFCVFSRLFLKGSRSLDVSEYLVLNNKDIPSSFNIILCFKSLLGLVLARLRYLSILPPATGYFVGKICELYVE